MTTQTIERTHNPSLYIAPMRDAAKSPALDKTRLTLVFKIIFFLGSLLIATLVTLCLPPISVLSWTVCLGISPAIAVGMLIFYIYKGRSKPVPQQVVPYSPVISSSPIERSTNPEPEEQEVAPPPSTSPAASLSITVTPPTPPLPDQPNGSPPRAVTVNQETPFVEESPKHEFKIEANDPLMQEDPVQEVLNRLPQMQLEAANDYFEVPLPAQINEYLYEEGLN